MTPSKEMIAAFADDELEGDALRTVAAAVAADPALQAEVDAHRELRMRLSARFSPVLDQPVPTRLSALLASGDRRDNLVDFAEAAQARRSGPIRDVRWRRFAGPALAATLVLAIVGFGFNREAHMDYVGGQLAAALDRQLVETQSPEAPVRILLSFRDRNGRFCRGFSSSARSGVACHDGDGWKLGKVVQGGQPANGEFRQAGSAEAEILTEIQILADGPALDGQAERAALRRLND